LLLFKSQKLSGLARACRNYSLPKLAHFLRHSVHHYQFCITKQQHIDVLQNVLHFVDVIWGRSFATCCILR